MGKSKKIVMTILIILQVIIIMALGFLYERIVNLSKSNLESTLTTAEGMMEVNSKISELEDRVEKLENNKITSVSNSTDPNNPDNNQKTYSDIGLSRLAKNVKIEVDKNSITSSSVSIVITDTNENPYGWGVEFKVQKKENEKWKNLDYISDDLGWISIAYIPNENKQISQKLDIKNYYGELSKGIYRIVKPVYDGEYIDFYSDEFEIK